ncbi:hypothetical protein RhiirA4_482646 [Rhizophagus irregularis]|uniref:Uncharacterized protein n=2 Tax=Rhizophagus irregularis TaxID=588596 RepID=A0A2I1HLD1_9GLOM|nr:hypothetical protein RhiirA4_482646 [Rhizophagus irregularis]
MDNELEELERAILSIRRNNNNPIRCYDHQEEVYHNKYQCPNEKCKKCGSMGHEGTICSDGLYYYNKLFLCGCNGKEIRRIRTQLKPKVSNHCCGCCNPIALKNAHLNYNLGKMLCNQCFHKIIVKNENEKRPLNPGSERENNPKRSRNSTPLPEPEDPLENLDIGESCSYKQKYKSYKDVITRGPTYNPRKREVNCIHCERISRSFNEVDPNTGLCMKCDNKKEKLERTGSTKNIRRCFVCLLETDTYDSRAGGDIVCSNECNVAATVINKISKDKRNNGKNWRELLNEKIRNQIYAFQKRNNKHDEEDNDNPKSELYLQIEKLVINYNSKTRKPNNDFYGYETSPSMVKALLFKKFEQIGTIAYLAINEIVENYIDNGAINNRFVRFNEPIKTLKERIEEVKDFQRRKLTQTEMEIDQKEETNIIQDNNSEEERIMQLQNHIAQQDMKITQLDEQLIKQIEEANQMINYNAQLAYYWQNSYFTLSEEFQQKHDLIKLIESDLENEFNELRREQQKLIHEKAGIEIKYNNLQETVLNQEYQIESLKTELEIEKSCTQFANQFLQIPSDRKDQMLEIDFSSMETMDLS